MGVQLQSHKDHWSLCCPRAFIRFVKTNKAYHLEQFSIECHQSSDNYFGFGFTTLNCNPLYPL